jgi:hypothetical protein
MLLLKSPDIPWQYTKAGVLLGVGRNKALVYFAEALVLVESLNENYLHLNIFYA